MSVEILKVGVNFGQVSKKAARFCTLTPWALVTISMRAWL
jgi:hypothetical protein